MYRFAVGQGPGCLLSGNTSHRQLEGWAHRVGWSTFPAVPALPLLTGAQGRGETALSAQGLRSRMYGEKEQAGPSAAVSAAPRDLPPRRVCSLWRVMSQGNEDAAMCSPAPPVPAWGHHSLTQPSRRERSHCSAAPTPAFGSPGCDAERKPSPPAGKHGAEPTGPGRGPSPNPSTPARPLGTVLRSSLQELRAAQPPSIGGHWEKQLDQLSHREGDPHTSCQCTGMGWGRWVQQQELQ